MTIPFRKSYQASLIINAENIEIWTEDYKIKPNYHTHDKVEGHEHHYSDFSRAIRENNKVNLEEVIC